MICKHRSNKQEVVSTQCVYVCVYACLVCSHFCMHTYMHMCTCLHSGMPMGTYVSCEYVYMCACANVCSDACT